jgi:predicted phosphodiesterase
VQVAALYDVHGNLPALEAVLADLPEDAVIVVGGDVAAGPFPAETLGRLRALGGRVHWLRGNADRELMPGEEGLAPPQVVAWVRARLTLEQIAFLYSLPPTLELEVDGLGRVLFCHATPQNDVDVFTSITAEERVAPSFAGVDADLVVVGHTHTQFDRRIGGVRVVNAGSVGMAYEDPPGAYWALLPGDAGDVEPRMTPYEPDVGEWPEEWPSASRDEATAHFETLAVGS